ncbi:Tetratricopeptide repeat-containing protein [Geodermatophilus dictyosporus]|uniref:Tetratricopeptide repeat-containing protein n=1 Tax=Geodermatophilus dictyosporus TaxID=1523247 RepID=A0A1I5K3E6_9ACTN|nr:tetratricopeptide repeat protein [Geodermatophilus dictyosporus]SFO79592.1 Tetratricopeptide repeat-containing protein [Geodermatophilus dictyosporus]
MSTAATPSGGAPDEGAPGGGVYEWYRRGLDLLASGDPAAAATLLARAADAEPGSRSVLEALARAQYDAGRYREAIESFSALTAVNPTDDYAQFGLGLAASRAGELDLAAEHLALAVAMRPDLGHYTRALRGVRARRAAGPGPA